jgi:glycosyltransferase involved in cell wall biosynthesis
MIGAMAETARPRLVFAACCVPYPPDSGARIRTYQLLKGLAESFDTLFVTFDEHPHDREGSAAAEQLQRLVPNLQTVTVPGPGPRKRGTQAASLLHRKSWTLGSYHTPAFTATLARAVSAHRPGIVHFDDPAVALVAPIADTVNVCAAHNVEAAILRFETRVGSPIRRLFNTIEAHNVGREEPRIWRTADLCLAVSALDGAAMKAAGARRVELCPNGVDAVDRLPLRPFGREEPLRLLFVGSGSYAPYERGLAWLVREVLPLVRAQVPVALEVVGEPPNHPLAGDDVRYVGRVPTVKPYYEAAHIVVVPVFEGSGTRLKIIEAAAYGRPLVSTRLGAEGLPLEAGEHYLVADSAEDFAAAVVQFGRWHREPGGGRLERMLAGAREAILPLMWPRVVERLVALYRSELEHRSATAVGEAGSSGTAPPDRGPARAR